MWTVCCMCSVPRDWCVSTKIHISNYSQPSKIVLWKSQITSVVTCKFQMKCVEGPGSWLFWCFWEPNSCVHQYYQHWPLHNLAKLWLLKALEGLHYLESACFLLQYIPLCTSSSTTAKTTRVSETVRLKKIMEDVCRKTRCRDVYLLCRCIIYPPYIQTNQGSLTYFLEKNSGCVHPPVIYVW